MHVAWRELRKVTKSDVEGDKRFHGDSAYLRNFYKDRRQIRLGRKLAIKTKQKIRKIKAENLIADETLAGPCSSIYVQPDGLRKQAKDQKKNPAVAAAGR
jgi:hypothetical protein